MQPLIIDTYKAAAEVLACEVAAVQAVAEVESSGSGFLKDGRPRIKFEGHVFHRLTKGRFDKSHPTLSYPAWTEKNTKDGVGEWMRLARAIALDRDAALMAASWGKFQILGENYRDAGFDTVQKMVTAFYKSEAEHLMAFVEVVKAWGLADELQRHDWSGFARVYNGKLYKRYGYDIKMAKEFVRFDALQKRK